MTQTIEARRAENDARIHSHPEAMAAKFLRMIANQTGADADQDATEDAIQRLLDSRDSEEDKMKS